MRIARPTYTKDGRRQKSNRWHVHFRDHRGVWRRLPALTDKAASAALGRRFEKLAAMRYAGESPTDDLARWLEGLLPEHRQKLAAWGMLDEGARLLTDPLTDHATDYHDHLGPV